MPAVLVEGVSVRYRVPKARTVSLKEYAIRRLKGTATASFVEHAALSGVSLRVMPGDSLAIVGPNGSGKTTLLRLISRVLTPTSGRIRTYGRVAPILDVLGALHPDLTGRENIFLNGTMLGLSRRQIVERLDRIVDFAEVGDFIDAPLRSFSSGMTARLGFAVASDAAPDTLVIDEALAVGDARFQKKCAARIDEIRARGTTFILVSHDMQSVRRLCTRAIWLERGSIRADGQVEAVVSSFLAAQ